MEENFEDICRLCALASDGGVDIYSAQGESIELEKNINTYLRVKVSKDDCLPKNVCFSCKLQLDDVQQFCYQAANAQQTLQLLLNVTEQRDGQVKVEGNFIKKEEIDDSGQILSFLEWESPQDIEPGELVEGTEEAQPVPAVSKLKKAKKTKSAALPKTRGKITVRTMAKIKPIQELTKIKGENCASDQPPTTEEADEYPAIEKSTRDWNIACPTCRDVFSSRSQFEDHCLNQHGEEPLYSCTHCGKQVKNFNSYRSHFNRHVSKFPCQYCDKSFSLEGPLRSHILSRHITVRPFMCKICDRSYASQSRLDCHLKQQHDQQQTFQCAQCPKVLQTRGGLASHIATHQFGKRFQCHLCGKTFTQRANMQEHVRGHQIDRQFSCDQCYKRFTKKSHLKRHMVFHTQERPFECPVCSKLFKTERCLKMHALTHNEVKAFRCSECGKEFRNISKLKIHFKRHSGLQPFECQACGRKFSDSSNAQKHSRRCREINTQTIMKTELAPPISATTMQPLIALELLRVKDDLFPFDTLGTAGKEQSDTIFTAFDVDSPEFDISQTSLQLLPSPTPDKTA